MSTLSDAHYTEQVRPDRIADDLWRLVNVPSPTGNTRDVAMVYAEMLEDAGADVTVDDAVSPGTPSVIGRLRGNRPGKTAQLAGHLDHITVAHAEPTRTHDIISGRGSADMKNGLAGILEVVRVLHEDGCDFPGQVLITAYDMHEAPQGDASVLTNLIDRRIVGDVALVAESGGGQNVLVLGAAGQSIWNITIRWDGQTCHELVRPGEADGLIETLEAVLRSLRGQAARVRAQSGRHPLLRPESLYVGQVHMGDFYNRTPVVARLQGTRRWHPGRSFHDVQRELAALMSSIPLPREIGVGTDWVFVGDSYEVSEGEPIVAAFSSACQSVGGSPPTIGGSMGITDAARLVGRGRVPTVTLAFGSERAHADYEYVELERLVEPCRIALLTVLNYLHATSVADG